MPHPRCSLTFVFVLGLAINSFGIEVVAIVRKIDAEKRVAHVFANGQERSVALDDLVKVVDASGNDLEGGLAATQLKAGETVTMVQDGDTYWLFFTGLMDEERCIGVAKGLSPFGPWEVTPKPIIQPSENSFANRQVIGPSVLRVPFSTYVVMIKSAKV